MDQLTGSSPLTRGKRHVRPDLGPGRGLIPTHAGKTPSPWPSAHEPWAHPHSRGENPSMRAFTVGARGSSPLTRGKHPGHYSPSFILGLIPTHAGKTAEARGRPALHRAHPHSRGENPTLRRSAASWSGSSPLTRGKLAVLELALAARGLIPTHAGKTTSSSNSCGRGPAHPHSRGENVDRCERVTDNTGSSPLTRGKLRRRGARCSGVRLIPTHAGKTPMVRESKFMTEAHPHSRGENMMQVKGDNGIEGSSPLTRGKRPSWSSS